MKWIKKSVAMLLIVASIFAVIKVNRINVMATSQVEVAISRARNFLGSHAFDGYCQRFVRISYEYAGISGWAASATLAGNFWMVSTSRENIPIGAAVYFTANSAYGHVGIYTGNGCMIHAYDGVREEPISDYWWARFRGWGYQGGVYPSGAYVEVDQTPPVVTDVSIIRGEDDAFHLQALVSDNKELSYAVFSLAADNGEKKFYQAYTANGVAAAVVPFSEFDDYEGNYVVAATAVDATGNQASAMGNQIELDVSSPEIFDVEIKDIGFDKYEISFDISDNNEYSFSCFNGDEEVEFVKTDKYYFYVSGKELVSAKICATDIFGYTREKIIEARLVSEQINPFFNHSVEHKLFRPLTKFTKSISSENEVREGKRIVSFEQFVSI